MQKTHEDPVMNSLREIQDLEEGRLREQAARAERETLRRQAEAEQAEASARAESAVKERAESDRRRAAFEAERAESLRAEAERVRLERAVRAEADAKAETERLARFEAHALRMEEIRKNTRSGVPGWAVFVLSMSVIAAVFGGLYAVAWRPLQRAHQEEMARIQGQIASADAARASAERDRDRSVAEAERAARRALPAPVVAPASEPVVAARRTASANRGVRTAPVTPVNDPMNLDLDLDHGSDPLTRDDLAHTPTARGVRRVH